MLHFLEVMSVIVARKHSGILIAITDTEGTNMNAYARRKRYRRDLKKLTHGGFINREDGTMIARSSAKDNSMKRDYHPQARGVSKQKGKK